MWDTTNLDLSPLENESKAEGGRRGESQADSAARAAVPFAIRSTCVGGFATVEHHLRAGHIRVILRSQNQGECCDLLRGRHSLQARDDSRSFTRKDIAGEV